MLFTPIYIALTFIKTWRIRSFRVRLLEFLNGNTSVAFCKVPENAAETPTLSSKLCTNPKNAYLCDLLDYTNATRVCSMKPTQCIEISDWVSCSGGMPLGSSDLSPVLDLDLEVLFECEMDPHITSSYHDVVTLESIGQPVAWKAGSHLAIVLKTNMENLSAIGFNFVGGEFVIDHKLPVVRIQTVQLSGEPNKATDPSMRNLRSDIQQALKNPPADFQWHVHAALLRKLSKVVDVKSDTKSTLIEMNGTSDKLLESTAISKKNITLADVSVNTTKSLNAEDDENIESNAQKAIEPAQNSPGKSPSKKELEQPEDNNVVLDNVTVEIQHNITPKKSSLKLDLKKGTCQVSNSLLNISSQIKSVTTHKRIVSSTGPKKVQRQTKSNSQVTPDRQRASTSYQTEAKSSKSFRPLVYTKTLSVIIFSDSVAARDNLETSLRRVLDSERYTLYSMNREGLESGSWRGRAALVAVAGCVGRCAPLLLAHLLDGGRLLALCSDLLHTVLPYYKTAEVRENEIVQFSYDKWKSVKMKHHIFCYQASPAKKQFSTENDRQQSKYTGHPGHELDIQVLASEETWRTPSLLQATDLTNSGIAIFSQIHLEADPSDYLGEEGVKNNDARLEIIHKILGEILGLHVKKYREIIPIKYTKGYFLGNHLEKLIMINRLSGLGPSGERIYRAGPIAMQWCLLKEAPFLSPSNIFLPMYVHECPENFSTVEYFDNLRTRFIGRLVLYSDVVVSTMELLSNVAMSHGLVAVARQQTAGRIRTNDVWLTPKGQASISVQVWEWNSPTVLLVRYVAAIAVVFAIRSKPGYESLNIRIRWPADIYYGNDMKIGSIVTEKYRGETKDEAIINIGATINISNSGPTTCVNDIILEYNQKNGTNLALFSMERFLALYCSHLEHLLLRLFDIEFIRSLYYKFWINAGERVRVQKYDIPEVLTGNIMGIDDMGNLLVLISQGLQHLNPKYTTFDRTSLLKVKQEPQVKDSDSD